jgi:hypothetical protein
MRKILLAAAGAATILAAGATLNRSEAMPIAAGVGSAAEAINPVEKTTCWRLGRFGWGWYPCGYYGAYSYWGPRPYWSHRFYGGPRFYAWHRWHRHYW